MELIYTGSQELTGRFEEILWSVVKHSHYFKKSYETDN